jgi:hypothetical protein
MQVEPGNFKLQASLPSSTNRVARRQELAPTFRIQQHLCSSPPIATSTIDNGAATVFDVRSASCDTDRDPSVLIRIRASSSGAGLWWWYGGRGVRPSSAAAAAATTTTTTIPWHVFAASWTEKRPTCGCRREWWRRQQHTIARRGAFDGKRRRATATTKCGSGRDASEAHSRRGVSRLRPVRRERQDRRGLGRSAAVATRQGVPALPQLHRPRRNVPALRPGPRRDRLWKGFHL